MKHMLLVFFTYLTLVSIAVCAEDIGTYKIGPLETKTITYKSPVGQVLAFKVLQGPELPARQKGFEFGWEDQMVYCEGKDCSRAGGYLLFCSRAGVVSGIIKNLSKSTFEISIKRVECEGKEAGTMRCPRESTLKAMCG